MAGRGLDHLCLLSLCSVSFVRVKIPHGSLLLRSWLSGLHSGAQNSFTSPSVSWETLHISYKLYYTLNMVQGTERYDMALQPRHG